MCLWSILESPIERQAIVGYDMLVFLNVKLIHKLGHDNVCSMC